MLGNQVHGAVVERVDAGRGWIQIEGVDGWVTTEPGVLLTVTIADCIPVYLMVEGRGVALLHAGWRGTAGGILGVGLGPPARGDRRHGGRCFNALWRRDLWPVL